VLDNQEGRFHDELAELGARIELGSVTDAAKVHELVAGCEVVFHLAAAFREINVPKQRYWDVNVRGVEIMAEAALAAGVERFVYCSTEGVHGHVAEPPADESAPINPQDYYEYTKWEGERALAPFGERGLRTVVLRPTAIYGPGDPERFFMIYRRVCTGVFPMFGDGKTFYHPVYIDNMVQAFELAMDRPEAVGQTYLIGDAEYCSIEELVRGVGEALDVDVKIPHFPFWMVWLPSVACEAICKPFKAKPPLFPRRADWYRKTRAFSIDKAVREIGYKPEVELAEGLRRTAAWYREMDLLPEGKGEPEPDEP
jgi:nucleoside-diphosphate-sugar epimerase